MTTEQTLQRKTLMCLTALERSRVKFHAQLLRMNSFLENNLFPGKVDRKLQLMFPILKLKLYLDEKGFFGLIRTA